MVSSAETAIVLLTLAFPVPLGFAWLINKHPDLVAKGQDAAGRGMAVGCFSILLMIVSAVLAIADAIVIAAGHEHVRGWLKIVGLLPLTGSIIAAIVIYTQVVMAKNRRQQRDYEEAMAIPAALIVDDDDGRFGKMYDAMRPSFPTLEISMRHPGALFWQQREWWPRLRLLMLGAEAMAVTEGQTGEMTQDLMAAMGRMTPACPIVLHALDAKVAEAIGAKLREKGWKVETVVASGDGWIKEQWREVAVRMLREELNRRPEKRPATGE